MSDPVDIAAIVATIGTIGAIVTIALFLRWCGRGDAQDRINGAVFRITNISDGGGVTDEQIESLVKASESSRVTQGDTNDPRWSKEALGSSLIRCHLIGEQCAQRIVGDETKSLNETD